MTGIVYELRHMPDRTEIIGGAIRSMKDARDFADAVLAAGERIERRAAGMVPVERPVELSGEVAQ